MGVLLNPLSGELEIKQTSAARAAYLAEDRDCDASLAVGDLVKAQGNFVIKLVSNQDSVLCLGLVIAKISVTRARVLVLGLQGGFSGLTIGPVFLSKTGGLTQDPSDLSPGYQQILGTAVSASDIFFIPNTTRMVLGSFTPT